MLKNILNGVVNVFDTTIISLLLSIFFLLFLEILLVISVGFTGIILGNKMNDKKTLFSIIYGFAFYIGYQMILLLVLFIFALFNKDFMSIFTSGNIINYDMFKLMVILSIIFYGLLIIINYITCTKLLQKGVNVD